MGVRGCAIREPGNNGRPAYAYTNTVLAHTPLPPTSSLHNCQSAASALRALEPACDNGHPPQRLDTPADALCDVSPAPDWLPPGPLLAAASSARRTSAVRVSNDDRPSRPRVLRGTAAPEMANHLQISRGCPPSA